MYKNLTVVIAISFLCCSSTAAYQKNQKGAIVDSGVGDELPKFYSVMPLELKPAKFQSDVLMLFIDKSGKANLVVRIRNPEKPADPESLKHVDKITAEKLFGPLEASSDECDDGQPYQTVHVLGTNPNGPNIYHLDLAFNKEQLLSRYRVRGFGITKPEWQSVI